METVIRASRLALGRTVLATHTVPGQAPVAPTVRSVDAGQPATSAPHEQRPSAADAAALQRAIEEQVREELDEQVRRKLDEQREDARKEGLAKGLAEGRAAAEKEASRIDAERRVQAERLFSALQQAHEWALAKWQADIGSVAFEAICRVLANKSGSREFVFGVVETVCREAKARGTVTARLHPRDLRLLADDDRTLVLPAGTRVDLVADETMALGGCVVETDAGQFDGSLDTQLRRLHSVLNGGASAAGQG